MQNSHKNIIQIVESYVNWLNYKGLDFNDVMPVGHALDDTKVINHVLDVVRSNSSVSFDMGDRNVRNIVLEVLTKYNFMGDGLYEDEFTSQNLHEGRIPSSVSMLLESEGEDLPYEGPYPETAAEYAETLNAKRQPGDFLSLATDQTHWDEVGVFSGEDLARYLLKQDYRDTYKELYGFKPTTNWEGLTIDQMREELNALLDKYDKYDEYDEPVEQQTYAEELPPQDDVEELPPQDDYYDPYDDLPSRMPMGRRFESVALTRRERQMLKEEFLREIAYKCEW